MGNNQKTGIPGPLRVKNGYMLASSQKYTRRATRLAKNKSYPYFRDYDPGTPVNGYYAWLSTVSDYLLLRVFVLYYVPGSLWLRSLFSFGFWFCLYLLFKIFTTSFISLYSTIMRTCLRRSIYSYVQIMHVSLRLLYYQVLEVSLCGWLWGIKQAHIETK